MNPHDPESAHRILSDFATLHERHVTGAHLPASLRTLAYPKQTIQQAIVTCVAVLKDSRGLTPELLEWFEEAYAGLAEYVDDELVRVVTEYREAAEALAADTRGAREKVQTPAWGRLAETGRLAGDVARAIAEEAAALRAEFCQELPTMDFETEAR